MTGWNEARIHGWLASQGVPRGVSGSPMHDAAVLERFSGRPVLCTDQAVEGVHASEDATPAVLARKAVLRTLSDLAATCAAPRAVVLAIAAPRQVPEAQLRAAIRAARDAARRHGCDLVGGDLCACDGPLRIVATALGSFEGGTPPGRDRARAGDALLASGAFGGSILGRHLRPEPRFDIARLAVRHGARAMMDVSDGLLLDCRRMAAASGVQFAMELARIPVHRDARKLAARDGMPPLEHALRDGEDHELLVCLPERAAERLLAAAVREGLQLARIGRVRRGAGVTLVRADGGEETAEGAGGWIHGA